MWGCVGGRGRYCNSSTRNAGVGGGRGGEGWDMGKGAAWFNPLSNPSLNSLHTSPTKAHTILANVVH